MFDVKHNSLREALLLKGVYGPAVIVHRVYYSNDSVPSGATSGSVFQEERSDSTRFQFNSPLF